MLSAFLSPGALGLSVPTGMHTQECRIRTAVRIVVFGQEGRIATVRAGKERYLMLPGGGVEEGETIQEAAYRETIEEVGVEIDNVVFLGDVIEQKMLLTTNKLTHSYAFMATIKKDLGMLRLTDSEAHNDHEVTWMSLEEALQKIKEDHESTDSIRGKFITKREILILEYVRDVALKKE